MDTLRRHCSGDEAHLTRSAFEEQIEGTPHIEEINQMIPSEKQMFRRQKETGKDEDVQTVKATIQDRWPESKRNLPGTVTPYFSILDELVVPDRHIFHGDRVVNPKPLGKEIIEDLHAAHQGIQKSATPFL